MTRYGSGETLASIARTYDCSPPAISYIVSRSRAKQPSAESPAAPSEPQLVKSANGTQPAPAEPPPIMSPSIMAPPSNPNGDPSTEARREPAALNGHGSGAQHHDGFPGLPPRVAGRPAMPAPQETSAQGPDQRRTLHLSLGGSGNGNGQSPAVEPQPPASTLAAAADRFPRSPMGPRPPERPGADAPRHSAGYGHAYAASEGGRYPARDADGHQANGYRPEAQKAGGQKAGGQKDGAGAFIDQELRSRVDGDIAAFLAAFDAALAQDTQESRSGLREATDRLLRAGARTRIELERLEARMPLPPRDAPGRAEPNWRGH